MGTIRFLLAAAVVLGHSGYTFALHPYYCVQAFFAVSGFYMSLVFPKYAGHTLVFYLNRYSRLAVPYWIVAATIYFIALRESHPYLLVPNATMLGADWVEFFKVHGRLASDFLLVPQGWSLGTELTFYALVPFLVPLRTRELIAILICSTVVRLGLAASDLQFFPWQQRFFPAEIALFIVGILAHRHGPAIRGDLSMLALAVLVSVAGILPYGNRLLWIGTVLVGLACFCFVRAAFELTRSSSVDRLVGEFSYPVYLWHGVAVAHLNSVLPFWVNPDSALVTAIVLSLPMVLWIEKPMERWRERNIRMAALRRPVENIVAEYGGDSIYTAGRTKRRQKIKRDVGAEREKERRS